MLKMLSYLTDVPLSLWVISAFTAGIAALFIKRRSFQSAKSAKLPSAPLSSDEVNASLCLHEGGVIDVAIIGGNVMGLFTALFCKMTCQSGTKITVFERLKKPVQKIGESGLASLSIAFQSVGISLDVLSRLFNVKSGLAFYHALDPSMHVEITNLDYSHQFDRRTLSLLLQAHCRRKGVQVETGCSASVIEPPSDERNTSTSMIHDDGFTHTRIHAKSRSNDPSQPSHSIVRARVTLDATGGTSKMVKKVHYDDFNCNAVWTYFKCPKVFSNKYLTRFEQPTTKHISFPEGWMWIIRLIDWSKTPTENLKTYIDNLLDRQHQGRPQLSIDEAAERYNLCPGYQFSIGFVIREDMDVKTSDSFQHWINKYDLISDALAPYERVDDSVIHHLIGIAFYNKTPVRDGHLSVGDSVAFTNPFFSRGMNIGVEACFSTSLAVSEGLKSGSMRFESNPIDYQKKHSKLIPELQEALGIDYRLWHELFQSPIAYERVIVMYISNRIGDISRHGDGSKCTLDIPLDEKYLFFYGMLDKFFKPFGKTVCDLMVEYRGGNEEEKNRVDTKIYELCEDLITGIKKFSSNHCLFLPGYDDNLCRVGVDEYRKFVEERSASIGCFRRLLRCKSCSNWSPANFKDCCKCLKDQSNVSIVV